MAIRAILSFLFLSILILNPVTVFAQCTDADGDGFYYENGCGTPRDCNDANAGIYPGAAETCNGFDDDCDGSLDEGCDTACENPEQVGADVLVTDESKLAEFLRLVWNGNGYGISYDYWDDSQVYFAILDPEGNTIVPEERVCTHNYQSFEPSLSWTGSGYGISYTDTRDSGVQRIYLSRFDPSGNKIGSDSRVQNNIPSEMSGWSSIVWTGHEYGVAFAGKKAGVVHQDVFFARLDSDGNKIGSATRISISDCYPRYPSLAWTGQEYGVAWDDCPGGVGGIYFARISAAGVKIGSTIKISEEPGSLPSLIWTGSNYAVAWEDNRNENQEIYGCRLNASGEKIGGDVRITYTSGSGYPSLAWTGTEYGVAWGMPVYFARLDSNLQKIGSDQQVGDPNLSDPSLVWTGTQYALTLWNVIGHFVRIACCDDADLDTYTEMPCSGGDCNDADASINPGAEELCDNKDNDCDATIDEGFETPAATTGLVFDADKQTMRWESIYLADRYDAVKGDLMALRSSNGDFAASLSGCLENDSIDTQTSDTENPDQGQGFYYLVRAQADCKSGTYNTETPGQQGDRDSEIESSSGKCQ